MTENQWIEIGGIADQEFVDFCDGQVNVKGWAERVKELGYLNDEDAGKLGGWEKIFWEACEYA